VRNRPFDVTWSALHADRGSATQSLPDNWAAPQSVGNAHVMPRMWPCPATITSHKIRRSYPDQTRARRHGVSRLIVHLVCVTKYRRKNSMQRPWSGWRGTLGKQLVEQTSRPGSNGAISDRQRPACGKRLHELLVMLWCQIYSASVRIGGWKARPLSHGKTIQVSCDTSVTKVSTNGRPMGLA
jgi:hypothetical protein